MISGIKKDVGMGLLVLSLYNMSCLHTAIPTPSFCGFWHGHPYIPLHFLKMFLYFMYIQMQPGGFFSPSVKKKLLRTRECMNGKLLSSAAETDN